MKKNKIEKLNFSEPNEISKETKVSMKTRIISAIIGIAIVLPCVFLGDFFTIALVSFLMLASMYELLKCSGQMYRFHLFIILVILSSLLTYWPFLRNLFEHLINHGTTIPYYLYSNFDQIYISVLVLVTVMIVLVLLVVLHSSFTVRDACFLFMLVFVISLGLQSLLYLRFTPLYIHYQTIGNEHPEKYFNFFDSFQSAFLLLFVALSTMLTDTFAYFVGILFGRNKMNERISPKKTWEGFVGGVVCSAAICSVIGIVLAANGLPLVDTVLGIDNWINIVILSIVLPLFSTLGDFVFSSIKRFYNIKDYGNLIPGHGGLLDRIDSLIFSMIAASIYISIASSIIFNGNIFL